MSRRARWLALGGTIAAGRVANEKNLIAALKKLLCSVEPRAPQP